MSNNNSSNGGIGFCGLLTIAFIVLKLTNYIDWSWWWVLSPLWIDLVIYLLVVVGVAIYVGRQEKKIKRGKDKWRF